MKTITIAILLILLIPSAYSLTAAIGNAKAIINVVASPEDPAIIDRTLKVINKNDIAVMIHLNPSQELRPFINIIDNDFVLQPGEEKYAAFVLTIDRGGNFNGAINVLFSPADPESKQNDVGLASNIVIISDGPIIEDPNTPTETEENTEEVVETGTDEEEEIPSEENETQTQPDETNTAPIIGDKPKGASPLIGISIMVIILAIGVGAFFTIMKIRK